MNNQISYADKVALNQNSSVPDINKVNASDMNEIKAKHNGVMNGSIPMGNIVVDSVKTKNLFNINGEVNIRGNTGVTEINKNIVSGNILTCYVNGNTEYGVGQKLTNLDLIGKTLTFSVKLYSKGNADGGGIAVYDNNVQKFAHAVSNIGDYVTYTYTATSDNIILGFYSMNGTGAQLTDIQVEIGNERTNYTPYQNLNNNPYVLYDNANGSISTIQLNDNVANYNYIEILFGAEDIYSSTKLYSASGKYVYLSIDVVTNTNNYFKNSSWVISGNSISFQTANQYNISSSGVGNFVSSTNAVKIYRVIGYK